MQSESSDEEIVCFTLTSCLTKIEKKKHKIVEITKVQLGPLEIDLYLHVNPRNHISKKKVLTRTSFLASCVPRDSM